MHNKSLHFDFKQEVLIIVEDKIHYNFNNKEHLKTALIHSSLAHEFDVESNERLEFFGDAVLEFIVSEFLYNNYKKLEGDLSLVRTSLVNANKLACIIDELDLTRCLQVGKSIATSGVISYNIKCDLYEAILGAMYLDGGMEVCKNFVMQTLKLETLNLEAVDGVKDFKTPLQEYLQSLGRPKIYYKMLGSEGPAHNPTFEIGLFIDDELKTTAKASSKKQAEQMCAKIYLENVRKNKNL